MNLVRLGAGNSLAWFPPRVVIGRCLSVHTVCVFETQRAKEREYMWRGTPNVAPRRHVQHYMSTESDRERVYVEGHTTTTCAALHVLH